MELMIAGLLAFIISGIDDFTVLVMLFIIADKDIMKNLSVIFGTIIMLVIIIIISFLIGDIIKDYMWLLAILLIVYAIKNIINNIKLDHENDNDLNSNSNLLKLSMWIFFVNAADDFTIYSTTFATISSQIDYINFVLGILIGALIIIFIAYKSAHIINNIDVLEEKLNSTIILNIPYYVMLIIGLLILYNSIN